jgi:hypothetical protein
MICSSAIVGVYRIVRLPILSGPLLKRFSAVTPAYLFALQSPHMVNVFRMVSFVGQELDEETLSIWTNNLFAKSRLW